MDTSQAWEAFCTGECPLPKSPRQKNGLPPPPVPTPLYVSTRTNIAYLSRPIELGKTFWAIPVVHHHEQQEGIIKKQMKVSSASETELMTVSSKLPQDRYVTEHVIKHIDAVEGRIAYKDVRKISIGICNKDVSSYRCKKRGAFYNCFSVITRVLQEGRFHEMHVKVFNTGKLEVPGVQSAEIFEKTLNLLCEVLTAVGVCGVSWLKERTQTVLINSNFSTGFLVDREILYNTLRKKYGMQGRYDPCSYPGIQCDFYLDPKARSQTGAPPPVSATDTEKERFVRMSFMVFRTGSVLIVGRCTENELNEIYTALCRILVAEYMSISTGIALSAKSKPVKTPRLKTTTINHGISD
jgi:TATA-box binding protein (TBP) (component of TFIID and TFIIIB)